MHVYCKEFDKLCIFNWRGYHWTFCVCILEYIYVRVNPVTIYSTFAFKQRRQNTHTKGRYSWRKISLLLFNTPPLPFVWNFSHVFTEVVHPNYSRHKCCHWNRRTWTQRKEAFHCSTAVAGRWMVTNALALYIPLFCLWCIRSGYVWWRECLWFDYKIDFITVLCLRCIQCVCRWYIFSLVLSFFLTVDNIITRTINVFSSTSVFFFHNLFLLEVNVYCSEYVKACDYGFLSSVAYIFSM